VSVNQPVALWRRMMKQCPECADDIPADAIFCPYCGSRIQERPVARSEQRAAARQNPWVVAFTAISAVLVLLSLAVAFLVERAQSRRNEFQRRQHAIERTFDELLERQFGRPADGRRR
jgi:uncharacterized membrane protein YvbJ